MHLKVARWITANDLLHEAVKHALASGDIDESARLIEGAAGQAFHVVVDQDHRVSHSVNPGNHDGQIAKGLGQPDRWRLE